MLAGALVLAELAVEVETGERETEGTLTDARGLELVSFSWGHETLMVTL